MTEQLWRRPCEHGRYEAHGGCGTAACREEVWYTDPQPDQNGLTPSDRATRHDEPQKGHWYDNHMEYSPLYWHPCDHQPRCAGGVSVAAGALLIERPDALRGPILDLVANELLTHEAAAAEIVRLLVRESAGHTHWFVGTARGERCEKCGVPRATGGCDGEG